MSTRHLALLMMCGLTALPACSMLQRRPVDAGKQNRWDQLRGQVKYRQARQQYYSGLVKEAAETVAESIAFDPTQAEAYVLLARANLELGQAASARRAVNAARKAGLDSADLAYTEGALWELRENPGEALSAYLQAVRRDPTKVGYVAAAAECLVELDRPLEALDLLDRHTFGVDDEDTLHALAAHIAMLVGDDKGAIAHYQQLPPSSSRVAAESLGELLTRAGRHTEALAVLAPIADSQEEDRGGEVRRNMARSHLAMGDFFAATRVLADYAAAHPDDGRTQLLLAKAALGAGDITGALRALDHAQRKHPDDPEVWLVRAALHWKRGRLDSAAADLYDVLKNDPRNVDAHCLLAEVLAARKRVRTAREHFEKALEIDPRCAWAAQGLRRLARAIEPLPPEKPSAALTALTADHAATSSND